MSFRLVKWMATLIVILALAAVIALYAAGPAVLEGAIISRMSLAGVVEPDLRVEAITRKGIHLSRVSAKKPRMHIDFVSVGFSLRGLLQGRVDEIFISGLKYHIEVRDNKPDLGLPERNAQTAAPPVLPFDAISLKSSFLIVNYQKRDYLIPFSSDLKVDDEDLLSFFVWSHVLGQPFYTEGQSNIKTLETQVHVRALWSEFFGPGRTFHAWEKKPAGKPGLFDARLDLKWSTDSLGKGRGGIEVEAFANDLRLDGPVFALGLEKGVFSASARFDDELYFDLLDADLSLAGLRINKNFLENIDLSLHEEGSFLKFNSRLTDPIRASIDLRGRQSSINELLENDLQYTADFKWEADFKVDRNQLELFSPVDVEVDRPVNLSARGLLKAGFSVNSEDQDENWFLQLRAEKAEVSPVSLFLNDYGLRIIEFRFQAPFSLEAKPGRVAGELSENSRLSFREVTYEQDSEKYALRGINLKTQPGSALVVFQALKDGSAGLSWRAELDGGFEAGYTDVDVLGKGLKLEGELQKNSRDEQQISIRISPQIALVRLHGTGVEIRDIYLDVPFILGDVAGRPGSFSTGQISYRDISLPGMTGQVMVDDYRIKSGGKWNFLPGAELGFSADIGFDPDRGVEGKINAQSDWFDFPDKEMIDRLAPALKDMTITGSARTGLDLKIQGPVLRPLFRIDVREAAVLDPEMDLEASGIRGSVVIDDFFPLTTPGNQRIDIARFKIGLIDFMDGSMIFRLESPESVFLEKTRWNLAEGGFIAAHASRLNLKDLSADFEIFFEDIDLLQLVSRLSDEKIVGSGLVYGRVPILYQQERVTLGQGYLYSVPGVGRLGIKDEEWLEVLLLHVRDAMRGHPYLSVVTERLELALRNFEYDFLAVNLEPRIEDTGARIELRGRGMEGDPPQEVGSLVININDLGEIVNRILRFQLTRDESIERALEDLFDF